MATDQMFQLQVIQEHFNKIKFPEIPAQPWQPGIGYWRKA
jgi:hypothetical protein